LVWDGGLGKLFVRDSGVGKLTTAGMIGFMSPLLARASIDNEQVDRWHEARTSYSSRKTVSYLYMAGACTTA
jgi:hypothetical protein